MSVVLLGGEPYEVRLYHGDLCGATRQSDGVHVEPGALWAFAARTGETEQLRDAIRRARDEALDWAQAVEEWRRESETT